LLADVCYLISLRYLAAGTVSIIASFQVAVAPILAFFFLDERLEFPQIAGIVLVIGSIILLQRSPIPAPAPTLISSDYA